MLIKKSVILKNLVLSLVFGLFMGGVFPLFASFFVSFNSDNAKFIFIILCIFAGLVVGITSFLISRFTVIKIVMELDVKMKSLLSGKSDNNSINVESEDVLGSLVNNFNKLIFALSKITGVLNGVVERDEVVSEHLIKQSLDAVETEKRISQIVKSIDSSLHHNQDDIKMSLESSEKINELNELLFATLNNQKNDVVESTTQVNNILEIINSTNDTILSQTKQSHSILKIIQDAENKIILANSSINSISNEAKQISGIIKNINDISDKTSILAMNASIEAARAGTYGRSFKIIANEVRDLAQNSKKYVDEISEDLAVMTNNINDNVLLSSDNSNAFISIEKHMKGFNENQLVMSENISNIKFKGDNIHRVMNNLSGSESKILQQANNMNSLTSNVNSSVKKTFDAAELTAQSVTNISIELNSMTSGTEDLLALLKKNEEELIRSEKELNIFK